MPKDRQSWILIAECVRKKQSWPLRCYTSQEVGELRGWQEKSLVVEGRPWKGSQTVRSRIKWFIQLHVLPAFKALCSVWCCYHVLKIKSREIKFPRKGNECSSSKRAWAPCIKAICTYFTVCGCALCHAYLALYLAFSQVCWFTFYRWLEVFYGEGEGISHNFWAADEWKHPLNHL